MECARILHRRRATLLVALCCGIVVAALISVVQPRLYQSQASIQIQGVNDNFLNLRDIYPTAAPTADNAVYVQTQADILQQDALIEEVVRRLHLDERREFRSGSSPWEKLRPAGAGIHLLPPVVRTAFEEVKKSLQILPSRGSSIIRIVCEARDPQLAADIANTLAQTFIEQSIDARRRSALQTQTALSLALEELKKKLLESEAKLGAHGRGFAERFGTGGPRKPGIVASDLGSVTIYNALKREVDGNRQFYETMSRRADEAGVASTVNQSSVRLVGPAQPAEHPHKPNVPLNFALVMFGSLALAIGYVMLQDQTNSALRAPGEAGACLSLPELGAIPKAQNRRFGTLGFLGNSNGKSHVERASLEQPYSEVSESFRAILASILASDKSDHPHIFVITSSCPMEGKTTVVSNLGIALAESGNRVLLIDGDLRRPRLHKVFDQINSWGLSDLLRERNAVEELPSVVLVKKTTVPDLSLLPSGTCTDNIFGLLCSGRMARLLPRFGQEFDYVLVDAPPCLEFADARIMARYAERLLLVVRADCTDRQTVQAAAQRLLLDGLPVMGVVLNGWDPAHNNQYGYSRYRGQDLQ